MLTRTMEENYLNRRIIFGEDAAWKNYYNVKTQKFIIIHGGWIGTSHIIAGIKLVAGETIRALKSISKEYLIYR